ncbi:hypothetical protein [Haliscomenobacter sp.]|uniref:hypothetical protein n=1 Tax=Haliscomenobacter sp. TaxID=2717303 RepID=UPI0033651575
MNEQIKQLALAAGGSHYPDVGGRTLEKFAELLIQECAQVADIERDTSAGCGYVTQTTGQRIKKYFGVEE